MQRQRGELVPIGEVIGGLGGPVKAIREASPQAVHHYTRFDQVNALVSASEACAGSAGTGERALRVSVDAALRAGIFKASGSIDPIGFGDERERGLPRPWSSSR